MKFLQPLALLAILGLAACNATFAVGLEPFSTSTATIVPASPSSPAPSATFPPASTSTLLPSPSQTPSALGTFVPVAVQTPTGYIDDRSNPSQLIVSFYSAINRKEYLRAYNYWANPSSSLTSFSSFSAGYQDTTSVDLVFGPITADPGMSQTYYTVPVLLKSTLTTGVHKNFAACYIVHAVEPGVFSSPPVFPMSIDRGSAAPADLSASDADVLSTACNGYPVGSFPVPVSSGTLNIDKNNFVDNRSGPEETVSSLLNALNKKQYVRAYSYFQDPTAFPGPYSSFAAGYADTDVITALFGDAQTEGAAGSVYYKLPLGLIVTTTSASTQTFVGCYTLRLSEPTVQEAPPFQPMGITTAKFSQVDNNTDVKALLPTACQ